MKTQEALVSFMASRRLRGLSERTLETYAYQLARLVKAAPQLPIRVETLTEFLISCQGKYTPETVHSYYRTFRVFLNWWSKRYKQENPMQYIDAPRVPNKVMPTLEDIDIELLAMRVKQPRDRALIALFIDTGIRATEAIDLRKRDIKPDYILVTGKVGQRKVPISDWVVSLLLDLPVCGNGYVFQGNKGKLTRSGAYQIVRKYLLAIGITGEKLGPHRLRHTLGRHFLVNGGDIRTLQLIMGHSNIKTTEKYASLAFSDVIPKHHKYTPAKCFAGVEP